MRQVSEEVLRDLIFCSKSSPLKTLIKTYHISCFTFIVTIGTEEEETILHQHAEICCTIDSVKQQQKRIIEMLNKQQRELEMDLKSSTLTNIFKVRLLIHCMICCIIYSGKHGSCHHRKHERHGI